MRGFSRHLTADFNSYNAMALARIQDINPDPSLTQYTVSLPDNDPLYCWAREEEIFTDLMTPEELLTVVSLEEAILEGMKNPNED